MSLDPQIDVIGQVTGSAIDRLGHRTLSQQRRIAGVARRTPTEWTHLAFANDWTSYEWVSPGAGWRLGQYRRLDEGTVELRGLITRTPFGAATWVGGQVIAVLPLGFRPTGATARERLHPWVDGGTAGVGSIDILSNGNLVLVGGAANPVGYMNLNGLGFSIF